jgi:hypothetical protein
MKKLVVAWMAAVVAGGFSAQALAVGQLADVTVTDRSTGATLPVHLYRGEYWVAGVPGVKYAIDIRNASGRRMLAVTSVDGVNVVSGETASTQQSGYVFTPGQRYGITGWRKSNNDVAAFEFTASPNSYAERTGRPRDVGVIGVALFRERAMVRAEPVRPYEDYSQHPYHSRFKSSESQRYESAAASAAEPPAPLAKPSPAPNASRSDRVASPDKDSSARAEASGAMRDSEDVGMAQRAAPQPAPKLGTGHGERERSYVTNTEFERESNSPVEVIRIRYDSYANLLAMGVLQPPRPAYPRPNPFPDGAIGYVPDPPQWR